MKLTITGIILAAVALGAGCSTTPKQKAVRAAAITAAPVAGAAVVKRKAKAKKEAAKEAVKPDLDVLDRDEDRFPRDPLRDK